MPGECHSWNDLDGLLSLPPDDPRLDHARRCPACRALLASYRRFLEPGDVFEGPEGEAAERRLASFIRSEIGGDESLARDRGAGPFSRSPRRRFLRPWMRIAGAAAAILLVTLAVPRLANRNGEGPISGVLRDSGSEAPFSIESRTLPGGGLSLSWPTFREADAYRVVVYGADLKERVWFEAGGATLLDLPADEKNALPEERPLLWRVVAFLGGDEIGRSEMRVLFDE